MRAVVVAAAWVGWVGTASASAAEPAATATLPLADVLRLHREAEGARAPQVRRAPIAASVDKIELKGRLRDDAIDVDAHVEVTVLVDGEWVTVPLFKWGPSASLSRLPEVDGAVLAPKAGALCLVTRKAGRYVFELSAVQRARADGRRRRAEVAVEAPTLAAMRLELDDQVFRLVEPAGRVEGDGIVIYPVDDRFVLVWETLRTPAVARKTARPPIEPTIPRAHASVVSTLEGRAITRVRYALRLQGQRPIEFRVPKGQRLEKVYVNGAAVPFAVAHGAVQLEVAPGLAGDDSAAVEVVLAHDLGAYLLSGTLPFSMPIVSWPVHELFLDVHLPPVFNYVRKGGSLEPADESPPREFTHAVPLPGKKLSFHQYLIAASSPNVVVGYDIDLSDKYYR